MKINNWKLELLYLPDLSLLSYFLSLQNKPDLGFGGGGVAPPPSPSLSVCIDRTNVAAAGFVFLQSLVVVVVSPLVVARSLYLRRALYLSPLPLSIPLVSSFSCPSLFVRRLLRRPCFSPPITHAIYFSLFSAPHSIYPNPSKWLLPLSLSLSTDRPPLLFDRSVLLLFSGWIGFPAPFYPSPSDPSRGCMWFVWFLLLVLLKGAWKVAKLKQSVALYCSFHRQDKMKKRIKGRELRVYFLQRATKDRDVIIDLCQLPLWMGMIRPAVWSSLVAECSSGLLVAVARGCGSCLFQVFYSFCCFCIFSAHAFTLCYVP